jgi:hypothetical protein
VKPFGTAGVLTSIEVAFNNHERLTQKNRGDLSQEYIPEITAIEKIILQKIKNGLTS